MLPTVACSALTPSGMVIALLTAALLATVGPLGLKALLARLQPGQIASNFRLAALTFAECLAYIAVPYSYTRLVELVGPSGLSEPLAATFGIALVFVGSAGLHGMLLEGRDGGFGEWQRFGWSTLYACAVLLELAVLVSVV
jgi:hypothetical protein